MNNHKKIDWFRWHQRKMWIRINCAIICAILLITLLLQYPIISNAAETKISDLFHFSSILNSDDAQSYYSGNPYDLVLSDQNYRNIYYDKTTAFTYEQTLKNLLNKTVDISSLNNPYMSIIIKNSNELYVYFHESSISAYSNYSNLNVNISSDGTNCLQYIYNISNDSLLYINTQGMSFSSNSRCIFLLSTSPINYRWNPTGENGEINYMYQNNMCGSGSGGLNVIDNSIIDNDYIGENSFMYGDGVSINQWNLIIGLDLNEAQMSEINKYHYVLDCTLQANYTLAKGVTRNQETSLLQSYGISWASNNRNVVTMDFSKTYTDTLSTNYFTIPSTVFNDGLLCDGYTAVPLVNYISTYVPKGSTTNEIQSFFIAMSNVNVGPFSLPGYNETEWFNNCNISYNFSMNIYNENDDLITSLPLAMSYNPMTGQQSNYSNGGGKSQNEVQQAINQHNENKTPSDPDYKNPEDYSPTITPSNNDNSSNSNSNSSSNSSPTIYNNASITLPKTETYPTTGLMRSFVRIINNDKNDTVEDLDNITGASSYIALMNNALSVIPQQVWSIWIISLKALFGITISAFFLKILINWAT